MTSIIRTIALSAATLVFLGVVGLWVRSYWVADSVHWSDRHRDHGVSSSGGRLMYMKADWPNARVEIPLRYNATKRTPVMPWWDGVERYGQPVERWLVVRRVADVYPYPPGQMMMSFFMPTWDVRW